MRNPHLQPMRTFDVLLPWLLAPCGTTVHVDTNYFLDPHWRDADWPQAASRQRMFYYGAQNVRSLLNQGLVHTRVWPRN